MRNRLIRLVMIVLLCLSMTTEAGAHGEGAIEGQVFDGTLDGVPLEDVPVTLWISKGQDEERSVRETTDGEGRVRFQGLDAEGHTYQLEVEYQGVRYESDRVAFPRGENLLSMPLTVYDSTTSDADLWIERAHLILDFEPGVIVQQEVQIFLNAGNSICVGSTGETGGATLHFPLPEGASGLQLMEGLMACCVVETERGFASNRPIFPGPKQFVFTYELGHQSVTYALFKEIVYPIGYFDVLVADVGVEITAAELTAQEPLSLKGGRYLHLTGQDLTRADGLTLHLTNLPLETGLAEPSATGPGVFGRLAMGLGTLAVIVVLGYPFLKRRQGEEV